MKYKSAGKIFCGNLTQTALSYKSNLNNLLQAIRFCNENKVSIKPGVELELTGVSLKDHFLESETQLNVLHSLKQILETAKDPKLFLEVGTSFQLKDAKVNCLVQILGN